jgi:hypothetical protein
MSTPKKTFFSLSIETWAKLDTWTYKEAFLIFLNLDPAATHLDDAGRTHPIESSSYLDRPEVVSFDGAKDAVEAAQNDEPPSLIYTLNSQYRDMLKVWFSGSHEERNAPGYYVAWAKNKGFPIANEEELLAAVGVAGKDQLGSRETNSLLTILAGIAKTKYKYNPSGNDSATSRIAADVEAAGLKLSDDTIRKWLAEAAKLLPPSPRG